MQKIDENDKICHYKIPIVSFIRLVSIKVYMGIFTLLSFSFSVNFSMGTLTKYSSFADHPFLLGAETR